MSNEGSRPVSGFILGPLASIVLFSIYLKVLYSWVALPIIVIICGMVILAIAFFVAIPLFFLVGLEYWSKWYRVVGATALIGLLASAAFNFRDVQLASFPVLGAFDNIVIDVHGQRTTAGYLEVYGNVMAGGVIGAIGGLVFWGIWSKQYRE